MLHLSWHRPYRSLFSGRDVRLTGARHLIKEIIAWFPVIFVSGNTEATRTEGMLFFYSLSCSPFAHKFKIIVWKKLCKCRRSRLSRRNPEPLEGLRQISEGSGWPSFFVFLGCSFVCLWGITREAPPETGSDFADRANRSAPTTGAENVKRQSRPSNRLLPSKPSDFVFPCHSSISRHTDPGVLSPMGNVGA